MSFTYFVRLMSQRFSTDVLIVGGGAAGLAAALHLADSARVTVLAKASPHRDRLSGRKAG